MKKLIYILFFFVSTITYSQTVTQTYYDKCTGETKVYIIPTTGSTIVAYYNRSMVVTFSDIQSGAFRNWLEATYIWWTTYNPCSVAQTTQTVVQQTASQATQAATSAATAAASNIPTASNMSASPPATSKTETSTTSESSSSSESSSKSESSSSKSEEKKEESKSESKKEEKKEEKKKEEKKQAMQPILIAANYMTMQNLDGSFNQVASFGLSKNSLTGATSYSANAMIWSNLKQFSLSLSKTTTLFNYDRKIPVKFGNEIVGHTYHRGTIYKITGLSATAMLMFDTKVLAIGMNDVFLLKKGMVFGYALGGTFINVGKDIMVMPLLTTFITKPFPFKRYTILPMLAFSSSPVSYTTATNKFVYSKHVTYIVGSNFDFNLTQRFKANLGINTISNTDSNIPMTYAITIGSKIKL